MKYNNHSRKDLLSLISGINSAKQVKKILIVGGSALCYGQPIITGLAAEVAGSDITSICLPRTHIEAAKFYSLNFLLYPFKHNDLGVHDTQFIHKLTEQVDVLVIGGGLGQSIDTKKGLLALLAGLDKKSVIITDDALQPEILKLSRSVNNNWVLLLNFEKFNKLFDQKNEISNDDHDIIADIVKDTALKYQLTIHLRGTKDYIADGQGNSLINESETNIQINGIENGLAGLIAVYIAYGLNGFNATMLGTYICELCKEYLLSKNHVISVHSIIKNYSSFVRMIT